MKLWVHGADWMTASAPWTECGRSRSLTSNLQNCRPALRLSPSRQATYSNHLTIGTNVLEWFCYASAVCLRLPPMASRRPVLLNHAESLCPARLPRASRGLCRGAFRDPARNVLPLTPSISLRLIQALSYTQITRETPRIPSLVFNSLRTLSFSVSCKSCVCHSYENCRVYTNNSQVGTNLSPLATGFKFFLFISFRTLLRSPKTQLVSFQAIPDSFAKTPGVGVGLQWHS